MHTSTDYNIMVNKLQPESTKYLEFICKITRRMLEKGENLSDIYNILENVKLPENDNVVSSIEKF